MRLGIIGFGNMGQAFALCLSKKLGKENIVVYDVDPTKRQVAVENGFPFASDVKFLIDASDIVMIAVKPKDAKTVLKALKSAKNKLILSIMAGVSIFDIEEEIGEDKKIVRVMPNLGVAVGYGVMAITDNGKLTENERSKVEEVLITCGSLFRIDERFFDSFTALAGSGPAFVLEFIDGLALAGVREGFSYQQALKIVIDTLIGSARLLKELGGNPNEWITRVSSPGGTTIEGIKYLEEKGFKGTLMRCIEETVEKARRLKG